ncbi:MAG: AraC family transcriptional regulator [Desulfovibrio sp.]|nr:AraC family transcriptional regulator [Desulfovibrio sp.]
MKGIFKPDRLPPEADAVQPRSGGGALTGLTASADQRLLRVFRDLAVFAETPEDESFMGPLLLQELHWRLLTGPLGGLVRRIYLPGGIPRQIACAVSWLRENYAKPLRIKELARRVNLSEAALFRQFKQATSLAPLQFQKRLRLEEARRLMVADRMDASSNASFAVGYESPHQFSREYKRLFGQPSLRDASRQRAQ